MGWWFVRQPNGLLAAFSTVVDSFTHYHMTPEEAEALAVDELDVGRKTARKMIADAIDDAPGFNCTETEIGDGMDRYRKAIRIASRTEPRRADWWSKTLAERMPDTPDGWANPLDRSGARGGG